MQAVLLAFLWNAFLSLLICYLWKKARKLEVCVLISHCYYKSRITSLRTLFCFILNIICGTKSVHTRQKTIQGIDLYSFNNWHFKSKSGAASSVDEKLFHVNGLIRIHNSIIFSTWCRIIALTWEQPINLLECSMENKFFCY